jgi:hypothetical protein
MNVLCRLMMKEIMPGWHLTPLDKVDIPREQIHIMDTSLSPGKPFYNMKKCWKNFSKHRIAGTDIRPCPAGHG